MPGFLYYLPDPIPCSDNDLEDRGLGHLNAHRMNRRGTQVGPDGGPGALRVPIPDAEDGVAPEIKYDPEAQEWRKCAGGKFWIGREKGAKCSATDLQRQLMQPGLPCPLSAGGDWVCPVAKALPSYWGLDDDDNPARIYAPEFLPLSQKADVVFRHFRKDAVEWDADWIESLEAAEIAIASLAENYRVSKYEMNWLAMPTGSDLGWILGALIDLPGIIGPESESKKNGELESTV